MDFTIFIIVFLIVITVLLFGICAFIFHQLVMRNSINLPNFFTKVIKGNEMPDTYKEDASMAKVKFNRIPSVKESLKTEDGATLFGRILIPPNDNGKVIIACHGARSSGQGEFSFFAVEYYRKGYILILPDHRGCGRSDGKFMGYGTHESKDTFLWIDYAEKHFPNRDIFLLGVSMGAATVLMMSDKVSPERIRGIIADCSYTSAWDEFAYQLEASFHLPSFPILHICDMYNVFINRYSFKDAAPIESVKKSKVPVLFIHGEKDDFVPPYMQGLLYDECTSEKYRLTVPQAVHARSYYTDPVLYSHAVENFIKIVSE